MLSDRKLEANRENATHSTGPVTPAGLLISSMNRTSHGLTARRVVLKNEDQSEFDELHARLMADYHPHSAIEEELVQEIAAAAWRLRRADRLETEYFDEGRIDDLDKLRRYRTSIERAFHKSIEQLRKIQAQQPSKEAMKRKALGDAIEMLMNAPLPNHSNHEEEEDGGFVSQESEPPSETLAEAPEQEVLVG